jgi:hypothetical protein
MEFVDNAPIIEQIKAELNLYDNGQDIDFGVENS